MSDSACGGPEPKYCADCHETLSGVEVEHGEEGFGHQGRCCRCYEKQMGVPAEVIERRHPRKP